MDNYPIIFIIRANTSNIKCKNNRKTTKAQVSRKNSSFLHGVSRKFQFCAFFMASPDFQAFVQNNHQIEFQTF